MTSVYAGGDVTLYNVMKTFAKRTSFRPIRSNSLIERNIYSTRYVRYRFSTLTVNIGTFINRSDVTSLQLFSSFSLFQSFSLFLRGFYIKS